MARRYKHSLDEIRSMILNSAENIIIDEGYAALNARKIAMNIGYTPGSIYMIFENMAEIVLHVNAKTMKEITEFLESAYLNQEKVAINELVSSYFSYVARHINLWRMLFEYQWPAENKLPLWYLQQMEWSFNKLEVLFVKSLPEIPEADRKLAIQSLWGAINGIYALSVSNSFGSLSSAAVESGIQLLVNAFVAGWRTPSPML
jgi:AcrR family transcriptional regulator